MCRFIWEWIYAKPIEPQDTRGISGGFRGHKSKSFGRLSNDWTDWHQIWYTSADSSGNGHRLNTIRPSTWGGGLGGHKFKSQGKMLNGSSDWHQIWHTCAGSSGNGYTPNKLPQETQGGTWGPVLGGQTFKSHGKLSNGWTDWHQIWYTSMDSSGNGHRLKTIRPTIPRATFWVVLWDQQFKILGNVVKRLDRLGINCAQLCIQNPADATLAHLGKFKYSRWQPRWLPRIRTTQKQP